MSYAIFSQTQPVQVFLLYLRPHFLSDFSQKFSVAFIADCETDIDPSALDQPSDIPPIILSLVAP